jgi:hypothetical protein
MLHQNGVHITVGRSPGLDNTYECQGDQSWGERQSSRLDNI